jgi:hypothetical protein
MPRLVSVRTDDSRPPCPMTRNSYQGARLWCPGGGECSNCANRLAPHVVQHALSFIRIRRPADRCSRIQRWNYAIAVAVNIQTEYAGWLNALCCAVTRVIPQASGRRGAVPERFQAVGAGGAPVQRVWTRTGCRQFPWPGISRGPHDGTRIPRGVLGSTNSLPARIPRISRSPTRCAAPLAGTSHFCPMRRSLSFGRSAWAGSTPNSVLR